jgi:hypothetical protein
MALIATVSSRFEASRGRVRRAGEGLVAAKKKTTKKTKVKPKTKVKAKKAIKAKKAVKKTVKKAAKAKPVTHRELRETPPRDEVREIFLTYDRDGSGTIDRSELARLLEALGAPPTDEMELTIGLDAIDLNRNQKISWEEFSTWWRAR